MIELSVTRYTSRCSWVTRRDQQPARVYRSGSGLTYCRRSQELRLKDGAAISLSLHPESHAAIPRRLAPSPYLARPGVALRGASWRSLAIAASERFRSARPVLTQGNVARAPPANDDWFLIIDHTVEHAGEVLSEARAACFDHGGSFSLRLYGKPVRCSGPNLLVPAGAGQPVFARGVPDGSHYRLFLNAPR